MGQCKVSVVMPAKNAAATIGESVDSILRQDLREFELLVIDDASTDQTGAIIRRYAKHDNRVQYIPAQGQGIVAALNTGLRRANSDYIARMDADDLMLPQRLSIQYNYLLDHPEISLVASQAELFPVYAIKAGYHEYMRWQNACLSHEDICDDIYIESPFAHPSVMFRNAIVTSLGAYRDGPFPEDYELWLRMNSHQCRFHKLASIQLKWRDSAARTSRVDPRYAREAFDQLRAQYLVKDSRLNGDRPVVVWGAGRKTRQRVANAISKGLRVTMWIDVDPNKIGNKIKGIWVRSPDVLAPVRSEQDQKDNDFVNKKPFVLCYVSNHGARQEIASQLQEYAYARGRDYLMVG